MDIQACGRLSPCVNGLASSGMLWIYPDGLDAVRCKCCYVIALIVWQTTTKGLYIFSTDPTLQALEISSPRLVELLGVEVAM